MGAGSPQAERKGARRGRLTCSSTRARRGRPALAPRSAAPGGSRRRGGRGAGRGSQATRGPGAAGARGGPAGDGSRRQVPPPTALPPRSASTPESWAKFTQENLSRAERERLASLNLRGLIDCILRDTAEDLRLQCDNVNLAFGRRCEELEDARHKLGHHLQKVGSARRGCARDASKPLPVQSWGLGTTTRERGQAPLDPSFPFLSPLCPGHYLALLHPLFFPSHPEGPQRQGPHSSLDPHVAHENPGDIGSGLLSLPLWSIGTDQEGLSGMSKREGGRRQFRPGRALTPGSQGGLCCLEVSPVLGQGWGLVTTRTGGLSDQNCRTTGLLFHPSHLGAFERAKVAAHVLPASMPPPEPADRPLAGHRPRAQGGGQADPGSLRFLGLMGTVLCADSS